MTDDGQPTVAIICGPTAAGKSAIALRLAERHGLAIVSADSRQLYRGFDIGTAKPTPAERARVPHYGIDVADPGERYSAARWADDAHRWLAAARRDGGGALVVGGTGFYLRALTAPLFDEPLLDPARRHALGAALAAMPNDELARWCAALDPARAHLGRAQYLRAVEVALLAGQRLSDLHRRAPLGAGVRARYLLLDPGAVLADRIRARAQRMLDGGWIDETRALAASVPNDAPAWSASGYQTVQLVARGELTSAAAADRIAIETRQYAKRQRTWFRHQLPATAVTHLNPDDPGADQSVERWWAMSEAA